MIYLIQIQDNRFLINLFIIIAISSFSHAKPLGSITINIITPLFYPRPHTQQSQNTILVDVRWPQFFTNLLHLHTLLFKLFSYLFWTYLMIFRGHGILATIRQKIRKNSCMYLLSFLHFHDALRTYLG